MEVNTFLKILKKRQGAVLVVIAIFLAVALIISFSQPLKYRSRSRLLIIQEGTYSDPYTVAKSNQYLSSLLSQAVYSGSFFDLLSGSNYNINWNYFSGDYKHKIKAWKKTIVASANNDSGIMQIDIYHPDTYQAQQLSLAVNDALINQNGNYQGMGNIKIKIIDQPTLSSLPIKPNWPLNIAASLVLGLMAGLIYIYYFPLSRREKRTFLVRNIVKKAPYNLPTYSDRQSSPDYQPSFNHPDHQPSFNHQPQPYYPPEEKREESQPHKPDFSGDIRNIIN